MDQKKIKLPLGGQDLIIETGKLAKQASAAVTVTYGGTVVLVTACMANKPREDIDFFPLMVEYQEKTYSAGRIPGGFFKREGRPTQKEILTSRVIDRPIRPLFPEGLFNDVQIVATVLSSDGENDPDVLAIIGASAALTISDIPFAGPIGALRVGLIEEQFLVNPTYEQREQSPLDIIVVGLKDGIVMIEGEADQVSEEKVIEALHFAFEQMKLIQELQMTFQKEVGQPKRDVELSLPSSELKEKVASLSRKKISESYKIAEKAERETALNEIQQDLIKDLSVYDDCKVSDRDITEKDINKIFDTLQYEEVRELVLKQEKRTDGRGVKDLRDISGEVGILPRTHGSSLFTRGQTQSLAVVTLGTRRDEQMIEALDGVTYANFMLHYNFPSFSVGETRPMRGPGRREIGHGALAAKALRCVLPHRDDFPYTIRIVSEILESNGSSSMASVCAGCLSLMDAGVPIKEAIAGISIGLITKDKEYRLLTDIMGLEDHFGDMDFKVAGSTKGITAIQLDLKIKGVSIEILAEGIAQAKEARETILAKMEAVISQPKGELSQYAPRILTVNVPPEKIGELIGPGGKVIKKIIEDTGVESIDIDDDGKVLIASTSQSSADKAIDIINGLIEVPEVGKVYSAKVTRVTNFGAFCEFLPSKSGLVHVSELSNEFVKDVSSVVKVGDEFKVKLIEIDQMNRINLSKKQAESE